MKDCKIAKLTGVISGTPSKIKDWQSKCSIPEKNCYNYENFDAIKDNPHIAHQTVQMDEMSAILLQGKQPIVPVDGEEGVKDLKIMDAIYHAIRTGKRVEMKW